MPALFITKSFIDKCLTLNKDDMKKKITYLPIGFYLMTIQASMNYYYFFFYCEVLISKRNIGIQKLRLNKTFKYIFLNSHTFILIWYIIYVTGKSRNGQKFKFKGITWTVSFGAKRNCLTFSLANLVVTSIIWENTLTVL